MSRRPVARKIFGFLATACAATLAGNASAATVNVDFGNGALYATQGALPSEGNTWNAVDLTGTGALVDSTGNPTSVVVSVAGAVDYSGGNEGLQANDLTIDSIRGADNSAQSHMTLTISGLVPNASYNLALYGVQANTFGGFLSNYRGSTFTVDGVSKTSTGDKNTWPSGGFAEGVTDVIYNSVAADALGVIVVSVDPFTQGPDSDFPTAFLNGVQVSSVPEPTSLGLLAVGAFVCTGRRIARKRFNG